MAPRPRISLPAWILLALYSVVNPACGAQPASGPAPETTQPRRHPELTVLGYVTPWNARGKELVTEFRHKFDLVSPAWYSVDADGSEAGPYRVRDAFADRAADIEWYRALQAPHAANSGGAVKNEEASPSLPPTMPLRITPRFILEGWSREDYQRLLVNETRWDSLARAVTQVVADMRYDGAVVESAATHALARPLARLADALHAIGKVLVLVSPPVRDHGQQGHQQQQDDIMLQSLGALADVADLISIMTYDMTGPGARRSGAAIAGDGPLRAARAAGNLREPGPNTSAAWVRENLEAFLRGVAGRSALGGEATERLLGLDLGTAAQHGQALSLASKDGSARGQVTTTTTTNTMVLAGLPLYGYKYPVVFLDKNEHSTAGRRQMSDVPAGGEGTVAVLRGPGEPVLLAEVEQWMGGPRPALVESEEGEFFFDCRRDDGFWRVFVPTPEGMGRVLDVVASHLGHADGSVGIALWEVGQASRELLATI